MRDIKVLIAGPSRLERDRVVRQLATIGQDIRIVGQARSASGAAILARRTEPHLVVLLEETPSSDLETIRRSMPRAPQIVLIPAQPPRAQAQLSQVAGVYPRSQYTNRALGAALGRLIGRISS